MKLYLAGIRSYQLDLGTECRAFSDPRLERTIQGIKREHNEPERRNRTPLTRQHLLKILSCLTPNNYEYAMIRASFTLAFAGFLCVGEFTYKEADRDLGLSFGKWYLTKGSIRIHHSGAYMELTLPSSKTDPFRKGISLTIAASHDEACPVQAMKELIAVDNHRPKHAPLFCQERISQQAFTREYVVRKLQELAVRAGLGEGSWNGHSFRRGAATWAAAVGIPENEIQILGRWRSDAYKAYIEFPRKQRISLSRRFQRGFGQAS